MEPQDILEQVKKDKVEFVSLQFADLLGVVKEIIIPVSKLGDVLATGVWFDGSSVEGFARIQESDLFLKPDLSTYAVVPWSRGNGKTARLICDIYGADGKPSELDPRFVLKRIVSEAGELGFAFNVGPESEFYLFRRDETGKTRPLDYSSYFDFSSNEGYLVLKEIMAGLNDFGIDAEASHHEVGQGQYEIDLHYGRALEMADKVLTLKYAAKKTAQMHGLHATFIPKPLMGTAGSGMHVHQSLYDIKAKENAFYDEEDAYRLSKIAKNFTAGQIRHVKAMAAVLCPTVNSYKRLVPGYEAPVYVTWASANRSALIRVPKWFEQKRESARIELRCPDSTCNPYLAFAVMLKAGLDGIKNDLTPPAAVEENVYQFDDESLARRNIDSLPTSLFEALNEMKKSTLMREVLGDHLFERYLYIKTKEWNAFKVQVTPWELDKYLDIY